MKLYWILLLLVGLVSCATNMPNGHPASKYEFEIRENFGDEEVPNALWLVDSTSKKALLKIQEGARMAVDGCKWNNDGSAAVVHVYRGTKISTLSIIRKSHGIFENVELDESKLADVSAEMFQRIDEQARSHIEMFHALGEWVDRKGFQFFGVFCDYASDKGYFVVQYSVDISAAKPQAAVERVIGWVADGELDQYTGPL